MSAREKPSATTAGVDGDEQRGSEPLSPRDALDRLFNAAVANVGGARAADLFNVVSRALDAQRGQKPLSAAERDVLRLAEEVYDHVEADDLVAAKERREHMYRAIDRLREQRCAEPQEARHGDVGTEKAQTSRDGAVLGVSGSGGAGLDAMREAQRGASGAQQAPVCGDRREEVAQRRERPLRPSPEDVAKWRGLASEFLARHLPRPTVDDVAKAFAGIFFGAYEPKSPVGDAGKRARAIVAKWIEETSICLTDDERDALELSVCAELWGLRPSTMADIIGDLSEAQRSAAPQRAPVSDDYAHGATVERETIATWLRDPRGTSWGSAYIRAMLADLIEAGHHERDDDDAQRSAGPLPIEEREVLRLAFEAQEHDAANDRVEEEAARERLYGAIVMLRAIKGASDAADRSRGEEASRANAACGERDGASARGERLDAVPVGSRQRERGPAEQPDSRMGGGSGDGGRLDAVDSRGRESGALRDADRSDASDPHAAQRVERPLRAEFGALLGAASAFWNAHPLVPLSTDGRPTCGGDDAKRLSNAIVTASAFLDRYDREYAQQAQRCEQPSRRGGR